MAQITFSVRMDADIKRQLDEFCAQVGMTTTTAINLFARAVLREKRLPFDVTPVASGASSEIEAVTAENSFEAEPLQPEESPVMPEIPFELRIEELPSPAEISNKVTASTLEADTNDSGFAHLRRDINDF